MIVKKNRFRGFKNQTRQANKKKKILFMQMDYAGGESIIIKQ